MAAFQAGLINELERLYKKKKVLVAVILSLIIIVAGQLAVLGLRSGFGLRGVGSAEFPILVLAVVSKTVLPLFTALVAIDCFSGEFSQNLMRVTLTRPVSRLKIYTAKAVAVSIFILANLFLLYLFSSLTGWLFNSNSSGVGDFLRAGLAYLATALPMTVLGLGVILMANTLKSGISVFFAAVLLFIVLKIGGVFFSQYSGLLLTSQLDWYNLWLANTFPFGKILRQFLIMAGYGIMFFTAGYYLFDKKEF